MQVDGALARGDARFQLDRPQQAGRVDAQLQPPRQVVAAHAHADQAIAVADLFLSPGQKIVSLRGRAPDATKDYTDSTAQKWPRLPLTVIVDEKSPACTQPLHVRHLPLFDYREALRASTRPLPTVIVLSTS